MRNSLGDTTIEPSNAVATMMTTALRTALAVLCLAGCEPRTTAGLEAASAAAGSAADVGVVTSALRTCARDWDCIFESGATRCETGKRVCVQCIDDFDCFGRTCRNNKCVAPRACLPWARRCDDQFRVSECMRDGDGWKFVGTCAAEFPCKDGDCVRVGNECDPGKSRCVNGDTVENCNSNGKGWAEWAECTNDPECRAAYCGPA